MELNFQEIEKKMQDYWDKNNINGFELEPKKILFSIDTPPPTVSGRMHLGHALGYSQADVIARYKKMKGFNVFYPFGFDDNGLATERFVEKNANVKATEMNRQEFVELCLKETKKAEELLKEDFKSIGLACDWNLVYRTIDKEARKIAQYSFIDLFEKKRIYLKEAPTMYCTTCKTAIAQAELEDMQKESMFNDLLFELENSEKIIISTTRPELLPACVAIFVNPEDKKNKHLIGKKAKVPLFDYFVEIKADKRVDPNKGTGIVMCCTFGDQTDMEWYNAFNLSLRTAIDLNGRLTKLAGKYAGLTVEEARKKIIEDLKEKGLIVSQKKIIHSVNVHERCKTPIEFLVTKQWFVKYLDLKEYFIKEAEKIEWHPKHMKVRYDNWIKGLQWDWCISRQRFFGVPFPVWYCKKCKNVMLAEKEDLPVDPLNDKPKKACACGSKEFEPEKDVLDTWFTSSLTPQINAKWLSEEKTFKLLYPMSLRPQGHDIITLWAFNTIVKGLLHHKKLPWKEIMINGFALDPKGKKMSKSKGNAIAPQEVIKKYSADMLRYWACSVTLGEDVPYQEKELIAARKFLTKLYNAAKLISMLTKDLEKEKINEKELMPEDKWIQSKLNSLKERVNKQMEAFEFSKSLVEIKDFFWHEFCDYYIEEVKSRAYSKDANAKIVLRNVLVETLLLLAPFMPHITDYIYLEMIELKNKKKSIHLESYPETNKKLINENIEKNAEIIKKIISEIRSYKNIKKMPLNKELKEIKLIGEKANDLNEWSETIKRTLNIKDLSIIKELNEKEKQNAIKINEGLNIIIKE